MINIENINQITRFQPDKESHIILNKDICQTCDQRFCVQVCPAKCYTFNESAGRLDVAFENCLECGTCYVICERKAIQWSYPRGGYGVVYRLT
ncbi:MAG: 4Fe-4S dicluster domain-containing protein [Dehalococcoidales bacterium]|nr:4Fe-4S dicluster domain-containing protein [Dehalococcoidales bacterium]